MTYWRAFYHLTWATKNRLPVILPSIEKVLYSSLAEKAHELGIMVYAINGWTDHVHIVAAIPPRLAVAKAVGNLKGRSSYVVRHKLDPTFAWQAGYGVHTFGERDLPNVIAYVYNQKRHHSENSLLSELEIMTEDEDGPAPSMPNNP